LYSATDQERAGQELPVLGLSHSDIDRRQFNNDDRGYEIGKHGEVSVGVRDCRSGFLIGSVCGARSSKNAGNGSRSQRVGRVAAAV
jgi:hypothetical protein